MDIPSDFFKALVSKSPIPELGENANLYGQFVGEWDLDYTWYGPDGNNKIQKGEWIFSWVLEGRAIQDIWIVPKRAARVNRSAPEGEYGTTLRFYDPAAHHWRVIWIGPVYNLVSVMEARIEGDEIVQESINPGKKRERWIFSEITENSFRWRCVKSEDDGTTWNMTQEMKVRRRLE